MLASHSRSHTSTLDVHDTNRPDGQPSSPGEALDSARLLHGEREVLIRHGSEVYRLRHTRNDKLILTK